MAAGLEKADLLYVDDAGNDRLDVFTYPQGKAVGEIDYGLIRASGLCSDKRGHVFVPGYEQTEVLELAHGKSQPIATLSLGDDEFPKGCAVDPVTGNLAVTTDNGDVAVFIDAKNAPRYYYYDGVPNTWYCTYDSSGNLFVGGNDPSGGFTLTELAYDSSSMQLINVPAEVSPDLGLQWDGHYLAIQAEQKFHSATILRVSVSGSQATLVGKSKLAGPPDSYGAEIWFAGGEILQGNAGNTGVGFWKYPAGGKAVNDLQNLGQYISGLTVSTGRK